jgi:hypothetical protein
MDETSRQDTQEVPSKRRTRGLDEGDALNRNGNADKGALKFWWNIKISSYSIFSPNFYTSAFYVIRDEISFNEGKPESENKQSYNKDFQLPYYHIL